MLQELPQCNHCRWHGTLSSYNTLSSSTLSMVGATCLIPGYDSAADAIVRLLMQVQVQLLMIGFGCFNVCPETKCFPYCWRLLGLQQSCTRQCIHFNLELSSEQSINQHEPRSTHSLPPLQESRAGRLMQCMLDWLHFSLCSPMILFDHHKVWWQHSAQ